MSRWTRFIPVLVVGFVVTACGSDPVGTDPAMDDLTPRMNGGWGTGGSATGEPGSGETTSTTSTTDDGTITIPTDTTSRGGWGTGGS
jgi:hypothetical protein